MRGTAPQMAFPERKRVSFARGKHRGAGVNKAKAFLKSGKLDELLKRKPEPPSFFLPTETGENPDCDAREALDE